VHHRRTGRAGGEGVAITLAEPREHRLLRNIEHQTKQKIEIQSVPTVADLRARRMELTRAALRETILAGGLDAFRGVVESLAEEFDLMDVAAAAVKQSEGRDASRGGGNPDIVGAGRQGAGVEKGRYPPRRLHAAARMGPVVHRRGAKPGLTGDRRQCNEVSVDSSCQRDQISGAAPSSKYPTGSRTIVRQRGATSAGAGQAVGNGGLVPYCRPFTPAKNSRMRMARCTATGPGRETTE
jgi:superfamily II DNA/RNA helicase